MFEIFNSKLDSFLYYCYMGTLSRHLRIHNTVSRTLN